jgi:hypothetical protein
VNDNSLSANIACFASEIALVNGVSNSLLGRRKSQRTPCAVVAWIPGNQLRLE